MRDRVRPVDEHRRWAIAALVLALAISGSLGYVVWRFSTSPRADPIPDSAFIAPSGVQVVDDGGGCGMGRDAVCDREFTVEGVNGLTTGEVLERVVDYLQQGKGWQLSFDDGTWRGCRDDGYECVGVVADEDTGQIQVLFTDCCGDPWPFD